MFHVELASYCPQCQRPVVDCMCEWNDYIKEDEDDYDDIYDPSELSESGSLNGVMFNSSWLITPL